MFSVLLFDGFLATFVLLFSGFLSLGGLEEHLGFCLLFLVVLLLLALKFLLFVFGDLVFELFFVFLLHLLLDYGFVGLPENALDWLF